ncbi:MAG: UDP-glucose 4-epimerase GalE [Pseudomonadota bacterium]
MSRTVIVTGGAGYIGSHACKALAAAGYTPVCYDSLATGNRWAIKWGPFERGDVLDPARIHEVFLAHRPVAVMHFAALSLVGESMKLPGLYYRTNVMGTVNLLDACRVHGVEAFVFSSTAAVYGTPEAMPIPEDCPKNPINPYGASKLMVERVLADYHRGHGIRHMILRYFNAAGADPEGEIGERRDRETHLIPLVLDAIAERRDPLTVLGTDYPTPDGTAVRDYIHVSDLVEAHVRALGRLLDGAESRVMNLGTGRGFSVKEVMAAAERVTGKPVPHSIGKRRGGDPTALVANAEAARAFLGDDLTQRSSIEAIVGTAWAWQSSEFYDQVYFRG